MLDLKEHLGIHRSISPKHVLPQQAQRVDPSLPLCESEVLIDVTALNLDSASFRQIRDESHSDPQKMINRVGAIVQDRGKMHNPVTGSGGVLLGTISEIGSKSLHAKEFQVGDPVVTLVSLSLTPLLLKKIKSIYMNSDRVDVEGHGIIFSSGIMARLPEDLPQSLSMAVLDVCGAPAQTEALCQSGQRVILLGGAGKSGLLCAYIAKKKVGPQGRVIALDYSQEGVDLLKGMSFIDEAYQLDATQVTQTLDLLGRKPHFAADLVLNVANVPETEMTTMLLCKPGGLAYFFSMATNFARATLGAEGLGLNISLMMGNGYRPGHAELTLNILRQSTEIRSLYEVRYGSLESESTVSH